MTSTTSASKKALRAFAVAAAWIGLWQILSMIVGLELLLPSPLSTVRRLFELAGTVEFWGAVGKSCLNILTGWILGVLAGTVLALATNANGVIRAFFSPVMSVIKATPVASFVMLAFVWIRGARLPTFCTFLMVLPVVWANIHEGLSSADAGLLEMAKVFRLRRSTIWRTIRLPALLPHLFGALRVSLGFAWKAGVAAEVIAHAGSSIGSSLYDAKLYLNTAEVFAWTAVIILLSVLLEHACAALMDRAAKRLGAAVSDKEVPVE